MDARDDEVPTWRKSTRSATSSCVEVAPVREAVLMRDSKDPDGPRLAFDRDSFATFIAGVRAGEFDRD